MFSLPLCLADVLVLLLTDVLIFLQEKDQKYTFPALVSAGFAPYLPFSVKGLHAVALTVRTRHGLALCTTLINSLPAEEYGSLSCSLALWDHHFFVC